MYSGRDSYFYLFILELIDYFVCRAMGVDRRNNRVLFIGNSEHEALNLW